MTVLEGPVSERRRVLVGGVPHWATLDRSELVLDDGRRLAEEQATYLPPCEPTKILCVHLNYDSRAIEFRRNLEDQTPTYFQKPISALNAHRGELVRPADCQWLNYEGEIAAIVGRPMRNVAPDDVWDHLAGFSVANDVGLHDYRDTDSGSMLRVKGMDGFCPIGPGIVTGIDIRRASLRTILNGTVVQETPVEEMIWGIDYLLADLCRNITLVPGDIILTGTPAHSRPMAVGDTIEVEVDGLGKLSNTVVEGPTPNAANIGHQPTNSKQVRAVALGSDYVVMKNEGLGLEFSDYRRMTEDR